jgi:hypothetical protein
LSGASPPSPLALSFAPPFMVPALVPVSPPSPMLSLRRRPRPPRRRRPERVRPDGLVSLPVESLVDALAEVLCSVPSLSLVRASSAFDAALSGAAPAASPAPV